MKYITRKTNMTKKSSLTNLVLTLLIIIGISCASCSSTFAANKALIIGGSCNEFGNKMNFVTATVGWTKFLLNSGWQVDVIYGNKSTQKVLEENGYPDDINKVKDFTWGNLLTSLDINNYSFGDHLLIIMARLKNLWVFIEHLAFMPIIKI